MNSNFNNKPPSFALGLFYLFRKLKTSLVQSKFSIALKIIVSSLFLVCFSPAHAALTDGLVAYWSFDDCTAKDNSGNGNDGTVQNNVSCVGGASSKALHLQGGGSLDSSGGHVSLPSINFASMPSYSVCLWVNEESMSYSHGESYISFGDHTGGMLTIAHFSNSLYFGVSEGSGAPSLILPYQSSDNNRFVHYCLVYNNGIVKGYKDQALQGSVKQTTQVGNTNAALGRHWWSYGSNTSTRFIGALDEAKIYNRALTAAEVTALYQQGQNKITPIVKNADFSQELGQDNWHTTEAFLMPDCKISRMPDTKNTDNTVLQIQNNGGATVCAIGQSVAANLLPYATYELKYDYKTDAAFCLGVGFDSSLMDKHIPLNNNQDWCHNYLLGDGQWHSERLVFHTGAEFPPIDKPMLGIHLDSLYNAVTAGKAEIFLDNVSVTTKNTMRAYQLQQPIDNTIGSIEQMNGNIPGQCVYGGYCARPNSSYAHNGVDYMVPVETSVHAICDGKVKIARDKITTPKIRDRFTIIDHSGCGGFKKLFAYYGHIEAVVKEGDDVKAGDIIGTVADWDTNSHLHLSLSSDYIRKGWGYSSIQKTTQSDCKEESVRQRRTLLDSKGWFDPAIIGAIVGWKPVLLKGGAKGLCNVSDQSYIPYPIGKSLPYTPWSTLP